MKSLFDQVTETAAFIKESCPEQPEIGIVLGSGLGGLAEEIEEIWSKPYSEIVHFPVSTVKGHGGRLIIGRWAGKIIVAMSGRFHYYEGYSMQEVTFPIRVMHALGVKGVVISNAAGGLMEGMEVGDIMLIEDHINMQSANPLHGPNDERWGPRFPDMLYTYDPDLLEKANSYAAQKGYKIHKGVYVGVTGPTFETPAEYRMFHRMGGGAVGMSTVPEVIVARHMGLKIFGLSVIADIGYPTEAIVQISHDIVVEKAKASEPIMTDIVQHIIGEF